MTDVTDRASILYKRQEATAFAPCHVSAFFVPHVVQREPERTGSWGAGICLGAGVVAKVRVEAADAPQVEVVRRDREGPASVTQAALTKLVGQRPLRVRCEVHEGAPVGQGFGVSAASALAGGFALARCLGAGRSDALKAAHVAEVRHRTGLGDAVASFMGGVVVRTAPGLPPYGTQQRLPAAGDVVALEVGEPIDTSKVLRDRKTMERITEAGKACMEALARSPSLESILTLGNRFALETQIIDDETLTAMDACGEGGTGMVAMLGNTVVAYGETDVLVDVLSGWGQPSVIPIDPGGLRLVEVADE